MAGGLDQALLDAAAGPFGADGQVGSIDLQTGHSDPGILKDALLQPPPRLRRSLRILGRLHDRSLATVDPGEDFAETCMIYHLIKGMPDEAQMRALMPERFAILDRMHG